VTAPGRLAESRHGLNEQIFRFFEFFNEAPPASRACQAQQERKNGHRND
jgi:hypothetical protein